MTEKDLKKLNRKQLLELLLEQTKKAEMLQSRLDEAEAKLRDRTLTEMEAGSFAEATLRLNGVFEAAEAAAKQYVENVKLTADATARKETSPEEKLAIVEKNCSERIKNLEESYKKRLEEIEDASERKIRNISKVLRLMLEEKKILESIFEDIDIE